MLDDKLSVRYPGILQRLLEKLKTLFCKPNQTKRELVVYRVIQLLELGAMNGWLDARKALEVASRFMKANKNENVEMIDLVNKIYTTKGPWLQVLPAKDCNQFSRMYAFKHLEIVKNNMANLPAQNEYENVLEPPRVIKMNNESKNIPQDLEPIIQKKEPTNAVKEPLPVIQETDPAINFKPLEKPNDEKKNILQEGPKSLVKPEEPTPVNPVKDLKVIEPPLPIFIIPKDSLFGVYQALKKQYAAGIFVSEEQLQETINQNKEKPSVLFYVERADDRFEDYAYIMKKLHNFHQTYGEFIYVVGTKTEGLDFKTAFEGLKNINKNLMNLKLKCIGVRFKGVSEKQYLDADENKKFIEKINNVLNKKNVE